MKRNSQTARGKEKTSVMHRVWTVVGVVLCVILIPILIINCTMIVKSFTNKDQVPDIGGTFPMIVLTDSMYPEIESGDLIICHTIDADEVKKGDIICFYDPEGNGTSAVTHRITKVTKDDKGQLAWQTKGDANNTEDSTLVPAKNLIGIYQKSFKGLGSAAMFFQTTPGLIICVVCPIIILVAYDIIRRRIYEKGRKRDEDELRAELEKLRANADKGAGTAGHPADDEDQNR